VHDGVSPWTEGYLNM